MARAQPDGRSAIDSASVEVGDYHRVPRAWESSRLDLPKQLPTVTNLNDGKIWVALALVLAPGYGDQTDVQWLQECNDASRTFGSFVNSGGAQFSALGDKLAHAVQSVADTSSTFRRVLLSIARI